jgi:hypothetical protein
MLTVCAWCQETEQEKEARQLGLPVSHGICDEHYLELLEGIHGCSPVQPGLTTTGLSLGPFSGERGQGNSG